MKILFVWSLIGLSAVAVAHGAFRHHLDREEESSPVPATTEPPPVNVSSTLSNYEGLNLMYDDEKKSIGFLNVSDNVAVSFTDHEGGDIKFLLDSKTGHVLSFQKLDKVTLIQNNEFRGNVLKVVDLILQNFVFKDEPISGNSSDIQSSSEDAISFWSDVYLHLGHPKEAGNKDFRSLKYLKRFQQRLNRLYMGSLKGLLGKGTYPLKQNLNRFLTISVGLHELFSRANGGLKAILAKKVSFEVNNLFNAKNGAEVFVYIMRQTGAKFDLSTLWSGLLNNMDQVLAIIEKLGGGESKNGVDETFALLQHFVAAAQQRISFTDFVKFLFESATNDQWSQADDGDFEQVLKDLKNITDQQSKKYDGAIKSSSFSKFFTNLTVSSLIENNVNISELVEKWRKRDAIGGLKVISHITFKLFSPEKYSNFFFNGFAAFLNATSDPEAVKQLVPGVPVGDLSGNGSSIWSSICKNYNLDEQLKKGGNANQILDNVPVFNEFSKIYKDSLGKNVDFSKILNGGTFSEYLSRNPFLTPFKWGSDGFSKFAKESGNIMKQIFIDPFQHFIPIANLPNPPSIPNFPLLQPGPVLPPSSTAKSGEEKESKPTTKAGDDDDDKKKVTSSKPPCDECEEQGDGSQKKEKPTTSSDEPDSTKKPSTPETEETHLTASVSPTTSDDDSEKTTEESSGKTTETKCDECEEKETKSSTKMVNAEDSSATTEGTFEMKHQHRPHVEHRHHGHHITREHHKERQDNIVHKYKHHHATNEHENKHDAKNHRVHQEKHHHEKKNHNNRKHNHGSHQDKHHERNHKHENHELKHNQIIQHAEKHHARNHHKQEVQR